MFAGARRGTILIVPILLLLAGVVILVGVVSVAMGRGGEMAEFATDSLPPRLDDVMTAADVAMLRPPSALWGYNVQATDEALSRIAQVITERDVEIAVLRQQLAELRAATGSHPAITATLLARSKARADSASLDGGPRRATGFDTPDPGPGGWPADARPVDAGPADDGPAGPVLGDTVPGDTVPGERAPGMTVPGMTVPGVTVPGVTGPGVTVPGVRGPGVRGPGVTGPADLEGPAGTGSSSPVSEEAPRRPR
jgi:hypothetical protein